MLSHNERLKEKIREAIGWGIPDNESTGMSQSSLCTLLNRALKRIEELEKQIPFQKEERINDI